MTIAPGLCVTAYEDTDHDLTLDRVLEGAGVDPYAAMVWPSAIALASILSRELTPADTVLDLGCGPGLVALAAAALGIGVVALDHDPRALQLVRSAADTQSLVLTTARFDLHSDEPLPPGNVLVMTDLLYEPALGAAAGRRAVEMIRRGGRVLVGDPGRIGRTDFQEVLADALGWTALFMKTGDADLVARIHIARIP